MATTKATTLAHGQAGSIVSGTLADARIPSLATSKITSGTFDDARIASSNVTQHEGSIDALASNPTITLGSNTTFGSGVSLANATFPAGAIVQKITKEVANTQISSSHSSNFPNHIGNYDINITPKYSDSKIIITFTSSIYPNNNGVHSYFTFSRDSATYFGHSTEGIALHQAGSDSMGRWNTFFMNYIDTPGTSGSAITYKLHARVSSGAVFVTYGNGYRSTMMLEEIKQ